VKTVWHPVLEHCVAIPYDRTKVVIGVALCACLPALGLAVVAKDSRAIAYGDLTPLAAGLTLALIGGLLGLRIGLLLAKPARLIVGDMGFETFPGKGPVLWRDVAGIDVTVIDPPYQPGISPLFARFFRQRAITVDFVRPNDMAGGRPPSFSQRVGLRSRQESLTVIMTFASDPAWEVSSLMQRALSSYRLSPPPGASSAGPSPA
jgi:hypothetical protein